MTGRVDVTVITAVLNEAPVIRDTVAAIQAQRFEGTIEFLFIDGGSEDGTTAILEELGAGDPRLRVMHNPQRQLASALNIGLAAARGDFVAQMDAHTLYPPDYIQAGVDRLRRGDVDWVSGSPIPHGVGTWSRRVALALTSRLGFGGSQKWVTTGAADGRPMETDLDTGVFAGIWRRTTLDRHGGWDEGWPVNHDSELASRYFEDGGRILCLPELGARYIPRNSLHALARQYVRYGYYRAKTSRRHPDSVRLRHLMCPTIALAVTASVGAAKPVRGVARAATVAWGIVVLAASSRLARPGRLADAATLPAVFATMHLAWGFGYLAGCLDFGFPLRGIRRVAKLDAVVTRLRRARRSKTNA